MKLRVIIISIALIIPTGCMPQKYRHSFMTNNMYNKDIINVNANEKLNKIRYKHLSTLQNEIKTKGMSMDSPLLIRAFKTEMKLELWIKSTYSNQYNLFKSYNICQKSGSLGPKEKEGDKQTPEGFYNVTQEQLNPNSKYFLSFNISFPNEYDKSLKRTGSNIMIHGNCISVGCLAMTDNNIAEIYLILEQNFMAGNKSVPVNIYPFRMTEENISMRKSYKWHPFWQNLKQGYDYFENHHIPAHTTAKNGSYVFNQGEYY